MERREGGEMVYPIGCVCVCVCVCVCASWRVCSGSQHVSTPAVLYVVTG